MWIKLVGSSQQQMILTWSSDDAKGGSLLLGIVTGGSGFWATHAIVD
jgi:hypothetical protein